MTDNEKVRALMNSLVQCLNASNLPIAVKALALDNLLLSIKVAEYQNAEGGGDDNA